MKELKSKFKLSISQYLLLGSTFMIPFYIFRFSIWGIPTNVFEVTTIVTLVAFLIGCRGRTKPLVRGAIWPYLLLVLVVAIALKSPDQMQALGIAKGWFVVPFIYCWLVINNFHQHDVAKLALPILAATILISLWAIGQQMQIVTTAFYQNGDATFDQYLLENFRAFGPFESPNYLAMFLLPAFFISSLVFVEIKNKDKRLLASLLFAIPLIALYATESRGGFMALGVTAVLAFYLMTRRVCDCSNVMHRYSWYRWLCGVTQYGFLAGLAIFIMLMVYAIARDPSRLESDMARIEIYRYSWQMVRDNPIWGVGLGNYHTAIEEATRQFPLFRISVLPYALHPHNLVMALWLNLGIAGLAVFAIVVVSYFRRLRQTIDPLRWAGALAMISILVHGVVDTTYFKNDLSALFWLTVALAYVPKAEDASAGQKD